MLTYYRFWEDEVLSVGMVKVSRTLARELEMLTLVFTNGNMCCSKGSPVSVGMRGRVHIA